jgi:hypothetical protein
MSVFDGGGCLVISIKSLRHPRNTLISTLPIISKHSYMEYNYCSSVHLTVTRYNSSLPFIANTIVAICTNRRTTIDFRYFFNTIHVNIWYRWCRMFVKIVDFWQIIWPAWIRHAWVAFKNSVIIRMFCRWMRYLLFLLQLICNNANNNNNNNDRIIIVIYITQPKSFGRYKSSRMCEDDQLVTTYFWLSGWLELNNVNMI